MKKFVCKGILFCAMIACVCAGFLLLSAKEPTRGTMARLTGSEDYMGGSGMLPVFEAAAETDGTTRLILGDSICRQLFSNLENCNPQVSMLATNAALMITGQYLLAEEYLEAHPDATDVYLVMHPLPLTRTFDLEWSYRYAVMTYVETGTIENLDANTRKIIREVYGSVLVQRPVVELAEAVPVVRKLCLSYIFNNKKPYEQSSPFEIADQYVKNLYDLCEERNVRLHVYAAPVSEYFRKDVEALETQYPGTWMSSMYPDYFENILFYSDEMSSDGSHFSGEYAQRDKLNEIIETAYAGTPLLDGLNLQ